MQVYEIGDKYVLEDMLVEARSLELPTKPESLKTKETGAI